MISPSFNRSASSTALNSPPAAGTLLKPKGGVTLDERRIVPASLQLPPREGPSTDAIPWGAPSGIRTFLNWRAIDGYTTVVESGDQKPGLLPVSDPATTLVSSEFRRRT